MITHGRGQLCMPLLPEVCERLKIPLMVETNTAPLGTIVHHPGRSPHVENRHHGPGAGLHDSGHRRSRQQAEPISCGPAICSRWWPRKGACSAGPGIPRRPSIWPGWPDWPRPACCAKFSTTQGNRADRKLLFELAQQHELQIISIEELIRYRRMREKLVYRIAEAELPTRHGHFS